MSSSKKEQQSEQQSEQAQVGMYARTLFNVVESEGRASVNDEALDSLSALSPEVMNVLLSIQERGEIALLPDVIDLYRKISAGKVLEEAIAPKVKSSEDTRTARLQNSERALTYATTLFEVAKASGHEAQNIEDLIRVVQAAPEILAMLGVMVSRKETELLPQAIDEYRGLVDREGDTVVAEVTTAIPLNDGLREKIRAKLEKDFHKEIYLIEHVDPEIIGGIILSARGVRRDASVRAQLAHAREMLLSADVGGDGR